MSASEEPKNVKLVAWYFDSKFVLLMLFIFGPFALPLVWFSPKFSTTWKIGTTLLAVVIAILLGKVTAMMFHFLSERLKDIQAASQM